MSEGETPETLRDELCTAWHRYIDMLVPLRPALYSYCRRLAGNVWDAEDLAQDTLLRAFGQWGVTYPPIRNPRAYLLRTATNIWIDTLRRRETEARGSIPSPDDAAAARANPEASSDVRDAGSRLLQRLSPQERAASRASPAATRRRDRLLHTGPPRLGAERRRTHRSPLSGHDRTRLRSDQE